MFSAFRRNSAHCNLYSVQSDDLSLSLHPALYTMSPGAQIAQPRFFYNQKSEEFFEFLERMQNMRMQDQRCDLPTVSSFVALTAAFKRFERKRKQTFTCQSIFHYLLFETTPFNTNELVVLSFIAN
ncbi:hypothetical protein M3Y97_00597100 [Aphelenchoides bicaudatus]|nr:hypothetical protein M3Y97_00597100 [Aphelenchoides bicaudatus]